MHLFLPLHHMHSHRLFPRTFPHPSPALHLWKTSATTASPSLMRQWTDSCDLMVSYINLCKKKTNLLGWAIECIPAVVSSSCWCWSVVNYFIILWAMNCYPRLTPNKKSDFFSCIEIGEVGFSMPLHSCWVILGLL